KNPSAFGYERIERFEIQDRPMNLRSHRNSWAPPALLEELGDPLPGRGFIGSARGSTRPRGGAAPRPRGRSGRVKLHFPGLDAAINALAFELAQRGWTRRRQVVMTAYGWTIRAVLAGTRTLARRRIAGCKALTNSSGGYVRPTLRISQSKLA